MLRSCQGKVSVVVSAVLTSETLRITPGDAIGGENLIGFNWACCQVPFQAWTGLVVTEVQVVPILTEKRSPLIIFVVSIAKTNVPLPVLLKIVVVTEAAYAVPDELADTVHVIRKDRIALSYMTS